MQVTVKNGGKQLLPTIGVGSAGSGRIPPPSLPGRLSSGQHTVDAWSLDEMLARVAQPTRRKAANVNSRSMKAAAKAERKLSEGKDENHQCIVCCHACGVHCVIDC